MIEFIPLKLKNSLRIGLDFMKKLQHHLMLIIGFFLTTVLTGCFCMQKIEVLPKSLPDAIFKNKQVQNLSYRYLSGL